MKVRLRKCKFCGVKFTPTYSTVQAVCSPRCSIEYSKMVQKAKDNREWQREKKVRKEALLSHSEWLNLFQKVFNAYIRARDKGQPCISCGREVKDGGHASHLFSVGAYPNLRFNELNVWRSCIECNLHRHGNTAEYTVRLQKKLGDEVFNDLLSERSKPLKLSIPEIKEKIKEYKEKTKSLI